MVSDDDAEIKRLPPICNTLLLLMFTTVAAVPLPTVTLFGYPGDAVVEVPATHSKPRPTVEPFWL